MSSLGLDATSSGAKEEDIVLESMEKFPWTRAIIQDLKVTGIACNEDPLSEAIMDIVKGRLSSQDLHPITIDPWIMSDGLAAFLRSGVTYYKHNPTSETRSKISKIEKGKIQALNWEGSVLNKAVSISTLMRLHGGVRRLATS